MRIYYIFKISEELIPIVKNNPNKLYETLESIYMINEDNLNLGVSLYQKLIKRIKKDEVNMLLKDIYRDNINYTNHLNIHTYND